MTNDNNYNKSLERYFQHVIQFIISSEDSIMTRVEISREMVKHKICEDRQVSTILKYMVDRKYLAREKLLGSKRIGYVINEEILGKKKNSFVTIGLTKKGKPIFEHLTQTELNEEIKDMIKQYRKAIANKKSDMNKDDTLFYVCHCMLITLSLSWISRLLLTILGGAFSGAITKTALAQKNIHLFENFLESLCYNLSQKFSNEKYDQALSGIFLFFEALDLFEGDPEYSKKVIAPSSLIH